VREAGEFLRDRQKVMIAGGVLGTVVLLLAAMLMAGKPTAPRADTAAAPPAVEAVKPEAVKPEAVKPVAVAPVAPATSPAPAPRDAGAKLDAKKSAPAKPKAPPGRVDLAVAPWGEIFVDGRSRGLTPPIKKLELPPGRYRIEVRNTTFAPHSAVVQVKSGEQVTVQHEFK
jgi:V8-like Glu-specific endopeptidase